LKLTSRSSSLFGLLAISLLTSACPPPINLPDGGDDNTIVLGPEGGLFIRNGYAMDVPRNAVADQTTLFITKLCTDTGVPEVTDRKRISCGYRFSPTNLKFATPVKIYLTWEKDKLVAGVDPGTYDMRRQSGNESFLNPLPGSRTNTTPFEAVEAPTDRLGLFWVTSPKVPNIDRLEVQPDMVTLRVGEMRAFTARVVSPTGETIEAAVTWSITPARVASVDMMGTVTARDPGAATLTATAGTKSATAKVFVIRDPPTPGPVTAAHQNPFPTGNDLWNGALAPGGLGTIFVGENGTVLARSSTDQWQRLFSSPGFSLRAIGGTTPTNAIAVGFSGNNGVAIEFRGTSTAPRIRQFTTNSIRELSTMWFDGTHGMAAGSGNNLLAFRNNAWVEENNPTLRRVMSIVGDAQGAFAVLNELGSIYRYDPVRRVWDSLYDRELSVLLTTGRIVDANTGESWAVGGGRLWRFFNGSWSATNLPSNLATSQFTAMELFDHRLFISGTRGTSGVVAALDLRTFVPAPPPPDGGTTDAGALDAGLDSDAGLDPDGGLELDAGTADGGASTATWVEFTMRGPQRPRGLFGGGPVAPTGYLVGDFGAVWEWDSANTTFIERSKGFYGDVADLAATENDVFVTTNDCLDAACQVKRGRVMHQGATEWEELGAPQPFSSGEVFAIVAKDSDVVVAASNGVYRWDGTQWLNVPVGLAGPIRDLKFCGALLVGAGDNGSAYTGTANQLALSPLPGLMGDAFAVSCPSQTEIWVAGDAYLAQRTGMSWTPRESMMVQQGPWRTVYAPGGGEAWAYGDAIFGAYWDGTSLAALEAFPIPIDVATASWGSAVDSLYMVGGTNPPVRFGFMMRFDGIQWRLIDSGSQRRVTAIDGVVTGQGPTARTTLWLGTLGGGVLKSVQ